MNRAFVFIAALVYLAACGGKDATSTNTPPPTDTTTAHLELRGADISALTRIEQAGAVFRDNGASGDAIALLRGKGSNIFRVRLFVNPNYQEVQVNDLPYTIALAKRIKAAGAKLMLDLHYSDTWADPSHQTTPASWASLDMTGLEQKVEDYTADVISQLRAAGALPDIVQLGNEIDAGMLWPIGRVGGAYDAQWSQFARLLKAGIRGVKRPLQAGETVLIMLHYSQGASVAGAQWFFSHVQAQGVSFDLVGLSYYPWWHGSLADLSANLSAIATTYQKDIMIVETSYPWRSGGWEDGATSMNAMTWPVSPTGQATFLRDLVNAVAATPGGHGKGVVWWYPEAMAVPGLFVWGGGSLAWFDAGGNLLTAPAVFSR